MIGTADGDGQRRYVCSALYPRYARGACNGRSITAAPVEAQVWQWTATLLSAPDLLRAHFEESRGDLAVDDASVREEARIGRQLKMSEREIQRLIDAYQAAAITLEELQERRRQIDDHGRHLRARRDEINRQHSQREQELRLLQGLDAFCDSIRDKLTDPPFETRQTAGLALLSIASGPATLAAAWLVVGVGMGFGLYEAAFATVAGLYGRDARSAITGITLFVGFASTVGWPASALFIDAFGWRGACLAWAALHLLLGLPLNRLLVPKAPPPAPVAASEQPVRAGVPWTMIVLACVFGATWFVSTALAAHLPRLLEALGATSTAAIAAGALVGPAQVAARIAEFTLLRRASPIISARLATGLHPLGAVLLAVVGAPAAIPFVLLHGGGNGMLTIARGTLPLALFGPVGYGLRTGLLAAPARILQGGAPLLFGLVLDRGGPLAALLLSGTLTTVSFLTLLLLGTGAAGRRKAGPTM